MATAEFSACLKLSVTSSRQSVECKSRCVLSGFLVRNRQQNYCETASSKVQNSTMEKGLKNNIARLERTCSDISLWLWN